MQTKGKPAADSNNEHPTTKDKPIPNARIKRTMCSSRQLQCRDSILSETHVHLLPLRVIFVRSTRSRRSRHVRFAPIASEPSHRSESTRCATSGLMHRSKRHLYSITSS